MSRKKLEDQNNVEVITDLMENPIAQMLIIEAVGRYARKVASSSVDDYPKDAIIHWPAWIEAGQKITEVFARKYGGEWK